MSTSAAANNPSWAAPVSTMAPFCTPLSSSHLFLAGPPPLLDVGFLIHHQHGCAPQLSFAHRLQGVVGLLQRKACRLRADGHLRGEGEELLAVPASQVRHRADDT